MIGEVL